MPRATSRRFVRAIAAGLAITWSAGGCSLPSPAPDPSNGAGTRGGAPSPASPEADRDPGIGRGRSVEGAGVRVNKPEGWTGGPVLPSSSVDVLALLDPLVSEAVRPEVLDPVDQGEGLFFVSPESESPGGYLQRATFSVFEMPPGSEERAVRDRMTSVLRSGGGGSVEQGTHGTPFGPGLSTTVETGGTDLVHHDLYVVSGRERDVVVVVSHTYAYDITETERMLLTMDAA